MALKRIGQLASTLRYLTAEQIIYRLYYRARSLKVEPVKEAALRSSMRWASPGFIQLSTSDGIEFSFLGSKGRIEASDWNAGQHGKLWLYNLHYLDDLNAVEIDDKNILARILVNRWIAANPPSSGNGWEPYPLSLRIVNLVKWFSRQENLESHWLASLATQMQALAKQVEYHILGNHLFANGKALVFGGSYLAGPDADQWLSKGLKILGREIKEQFLGDGAHFELSPMYHATLLWDMCDLVNLAERVDLPELKVRLPEWRAIVVQGLRWLRSMQHPDGGIPFFNDAAFGIAPTLSDLEVYASRLEGCLPLPDVGEGSFDARYHAQSGYASIDLGGGNKALLDLARVGPDYQPGHAHADTLSFELSLFGQRIFVNSGTSQYGDDAERHRQRSTSAHNTVEVDGENSSEVWSGFRVARRAYPVLELFVDQLDKVLIQASHTGYLRLKGRVLHRREWLFESGHIEVLDKVEGEHGVAVARLYVHPEIRFMEEQGRFIARLGEGECVTVEFKGGESSRLVRSTWHPEFGTNIENQCIESIFRDGALATHIYWGALV
ncbi:heparinase II/III family protein [Stutzerimonas nitrititolerans]|uniref:heparinase II/III family protein n=1 Tax=Stutzerimonas nitrititolerans TaxID=2482751 RepID=UPI0028ADFCF8|nr:alginate lyase family protein [Stutzerimonas nitrititolerans]